MKTLAAAICANLLLCAPLQAAVVGGAVTGGEVYGMGAQFQKVTPGDGFSVGGDEINQVHLFAFDERTQVLATSDIVGEIGGTVRAGMVVDSHYVFYDPPHPHMGQVGYVDFDRPVVSVVASNASVRETVEYGLDIVRYRGDPARGLEAEDQVWIDPQNPFRVWTSWFASRPGDHLRIFTDASSSDLLATPLPAPGLLLLGGVVALWVRRRV